MVENRLKSAKSDRQSPKISQNGPEALSKCGHMLSGGAFAPLECMWPLIRKERCKKKRGGILYGHAERFGLPQVVHVKLALDLYTSYPFLRMEYG